MAWTTKKGSLEKHVLPESEYWRLFNYFFSDSCRKTSTYKFALLKAILDNLLNNIPQINGEKFFLSDIFAKFAESFWNLVVKYGLHQQKPNIQGQISKIEQIFLRAIKENPLLESMEFAAIRKEEQDALIRQVRSECKKYVLGAMYDDFSQSLYAFDLNEDFILLSFGAYDFLLKYKMELEKLNYYHWARFLENINEESVLYGVIGKIEQSLPKREPLSIFRKILQTEFETDNCFYCGRKLSGIVHVDHFIPWSFVKEDRLWNFVLSCPECNLKKSDSLPAETLLAKLDAQNSYFLSHETSFETSFIKRQFENYNPELLSNLWHYAKHAGFRTMKNSPLPQGRDKHK